MSDAAIVRGAGAHLAGGRRNEPVRYFPRLDGAAPAVRPRTVPPGPIALYIHIPFCDRRCHFCDFAVVAGQRRGTALVDDYVDALKAEMTDAADRLRDPRVHIQTIQVGGGTPTFLEAAALEDLLHFVLEELACHDVEEIVVEGFPSSITKTKLAALERFPALRLNIGVQTFNDETLAASGRRHDGAEAMASLVDAVGSSIRDVGVDLICGLPGSSEETVIADLEAAAAAGADHVAFYPLWVYEGTGLASLIERRQVMPTSPGSLERQFATGLKALAALGFGRYSAFHHARSDGARHRYGQWQMLARNWLGFGLSAMSHIDGTIWFNDRNINRYMAAVTDPKHAQTLTLHERMRFSFMYGVRLREFPAQEFAERFGANVVEVFGDEILEFERRGWVERAGGTIFVTQAGILALGQMEAELGVG